MAMTADSTSNHYSSSGSGFCGDGLSSPQLRRKNLPSPWAQVVRGQPDSVLAAAHQSPSSSSSPPTTLYEPTDNSNNNFSSSKVASASSSSPPDNSPPDGSMEAESSDASNGNAAPPKKSAWNKPSSNGVQESSNNLLGTLWPALSESTNASPKSSLVDSDGSVSTSQVPVIAQLPQKLTTANANPNSNPNRTMPARQRKRGGNNASSSGSGPAQTSFTRPPQPPSTPPFPVLMPPNSYGNLVPAMVDPSPRELMYRGNNWDSRPGGGYASQPHSVNNHRNSSRRGNYGPCGVGDGNYHNNFGGRRDQDHGNYVNARDVRVQPQRGPPRGFVRPPPPNAGTLIPPQTMRPFANHPMGFPEFIYIPPVPMEPFRGVPGMPFMTPAPHAAVLMPVPEPPIALLLVHQIDYYFSDANLVKDEFLKSNMDDQGWVPITLIASFPRVKNLTNNIQLILESLRTSAVVEVQDDKVRRRNEWMKWIPTPSWVPTEPGLPSPVGSSNDVLATSFQTMTVEGDTANPHTQDARGRHSTELTEPGVCGGGGAILWGVRGCTEDSFSNEN